VAVKVVVHPIDQRKVGVAADGRELYEVIKDLARRQDGGGRHSVHSPLLPPTLAVGRAGVKGVARDAR